MFDTKVCKQCKYDTHKYSGRLPKYVEFDADFKSCEKLAKGLPKKVRGPRTLNTIIKEEKPHNFYSFMLITFCRSFLQLFQGIQSQHKILHLFIPILIFLGQKFLSSY